MNIKCKNKIQQHLNKMSELVEQSKEELIGDEIEPFQYTLLSISVQINNIVDEIDTDN
jgi:hypothetical protein